MLILIILDKRFNSFLLSHFLFGKDTEYRKNYQLAQLEF